MILIGQSCDCFNLLMLQDIAESLSLPPLFKYCSKYRLMRGGLKVVSLASM